MGLLDFDYNLWNKHCYRMGVPERVLCANHIAAQVRRHGERVRREVQLPRPGRAPDEAANGVFNHETTEDFVHSAYRLHDERVSGMSKKHEEYLNSTI